MPVTEDDLRLRLKFEPSLWTVDDAEFADRAIQSAGVLVRSVAGVDAVALAEATGDAPRLAAVDEATLAYASLLFSNPERVMQRRSGSDNSVSFSDSSLAAIGLAEVEAILSGYFSLGRVRSTWVAGHLGSDDWLQL